MSRRVGISRVKQNSNKTEKVVQKVNNEKKQLSELFSDFDLSDVNINIELNQSNTSFKSSKTAFNQIDYKAEQTEANIGFSSDNCYKEFDKQNDDKNGLNFKCISEGLKTSFDSFSKSFVIPNCTEFNKSNVDLNKNNKRKLKSELFDDIDLTDLKFDNTLANFQSANKIIKTSDKSIDENESIDVCKEIESNDVHIENQYINIESHNQNIVENGNNCQINNQIVTKEYFKDLSNKNNCSTPKTIKQIVDTSADFLFDEEEDALFLSCVQGIEQSLNSTKPNVNDSDLNNEKTTVNQNTCVLDQNQDSSDEDIHYILRTDYCTYNEENTETFLSKHSKYYESCAYDYYTAFKNGFIGFFTGNGEQCFVSESFRCKARLLFEDLENLTLKEVKAIQMNLRSEVKSSNDNINESNFSCDSINSIVNVNTTSKICDQRQNTCKERERKSSTYISDFRAKCNLLDPYNNSLKCYPLGQQNSKRVICKTTLFENTINESLIPCTSTPKASTFRRVRFEPKRSLPFTDKLNDI